MVEALNETPVPSYLRIAASDFHASRLLMIPAMLAFALAVIDVITWQTALPYPPSRSELLTAHALVIPLVLPGLARVLFVRQVFRRGVVITATIEDVRYPRLRISGIGTPVRVSYVYVGGSYSHSFVVYSGRKRRQLAGSKTTEILVDPSKPSRAFSLVAWQPEPFTLV